MFKIWFPLLFFLLLFSGCIPIQRDSSVAALPAGGETPSPTATTPVQGEEALKRAEVEIDSLAILVSDGFPPKYQLEVKGSLPTPCHDLRTVVEMAAIQSEIRVQVFSVYDPYTVCAQVMKPFDAALPLGSYVRGSYPVIVNGTEVGKITP